MGEELLLLVRRVGGGDRLAQHVGRSRAGDPVEQLLVDVGQALGAELVVLRGLEVLVGQLLVRLELVVVVERLVVGDRELPLGVQVDLGRAGRSPAQNADHFTSALIAHGK